ncbi:MAG: hypothetical protein ACLKAN_13920 [Alkaliphilus sp.]
MNMLENKFNADMQNIYLTAKEKLGYNATRFLQLLSEKGGLQAAKILISKDGATYGFEVLWENKRLDLSVEALVLKNEYQPLFSSKEREICLKRLKDFGYTPPMGCEKRICCENGQ